MSGTLQVLFGNLAVTFTYEDRQAELQLGLLFNDWPSSPEWLAEADASPPIKRPISFAIVVTEQLGDPPANSRLIYSEQNGNVPAGSALTNVCKLAGYHVICFGYDAIVQVPDGEGDEIRETVVHAQVTRDALFSGRLEDIVFCSLAPLLRRRGFFLVHAFAVAKDRRCLLLVGDSGSGKTTTGLKLISRGWQYLANDVTLLEEQEGIVQAWPTPGGIGLARESLELLPQLLPGAGDSNAFVGKRFFPATRFVEGWAPPATVTQILFPKVSADRAISLRRQTRSIALARLMEGSIDRWDVPCLDSHLRLLEMLSRQAEAYDLRLGPDLDRLSDALSQVW